MAKKNYPVVHFEMPMDDVKRVSKFYEQAFGWEMKDMGQEYGGYLMAMTDESDKNGPLEKGRINGGFFKREEAKDPMRFVVYVDDINEAMEKVEKAGGKVVQEMTDIPNVGKYVLIVDTEKNVVGMLQPASM